MLFISNVGASRIAGVIEIDCNTDVYSFAENMAEKFMDKYPRIQVFIQVLPGEEAIDRLKRGLTDIVLSTEYINFRNTVPQVLTKDGIVFITNGQNTKDNLTSEELLNIISGKARTWNALGLNAVLPRPIEFYGLDEATKTLKLFKEFFVDVKLGSFAVLSSDEEVIKQIAANRYALGYISLSSVNLMDDKVKLVSIDDVIPTSDNIFNNTYRLTKTCYFTTDTTPYGVIKLFLEFIRNEDATANNYGLTSQKEGFK